MFSEYHDVPGTLSLIQFKHHNSLSELGSITPHFIVEETDLEK